MRTRAAIAQPSPTLLAPASHPSVDRALGDAGGLGRRPHRPTLLENPVDQQPAAGRTGAGGTVELHPVSSFGLRGLSTTQPPRRPGCLYRRTSLGTTARLGSGGRVLSERGAQPRFRVVVALDVVD